PQDYREEVPDVRVVIHEFRADRLEPRSWCDEEKNTGPMEEISELPVDKCNKSKMLKIGKNLNVQLQGKLKTFLKDNLDIFT
ncbi:hypothetical protein PanWU01x14_333620, partial [Parasponia andersonii]